MAFLKRKLIEKTIVNPESVGPGEADWFVRFNTGPRWTDLRGGGARIGDGSWVVTAAHVVAAKEGKPVDRAYLETYTRDEVLQGTNYARILSVCVHPSYNPNASMVNGWIPNDIAVVRISKSGGTRLRLASAVPPVDTPGTIFGWGYSFNFTGTVGTTLNRNKPENVPVVRHLDGESFRATSMACTGDSGAPFVVGGEVVGIYSGDGHPKRCSIELDAYATVASYRTWIKDVIAGNGQCKP